MKVRMYTVSLCIAILAKIIIMTFHTPVTNPLNRRRITSITVKPFVQIALFLEVDGLKVQWFMIRKMKSLIATDRRLHLEKRMFRIVMVPHLFITRRTEIEIRTRCTLVPNPPKILVTSITNNMRMNRRIRTRQIERHPPARTSTERQTRLSSGPRVIGGINSCCRCCRRGGFRRRMFLNLNLDVRVGDADFDHGMGRGVSAAGEGNGFKVLILFALFAEIEIGADGAFVPNSADVEFIVLAGSAVA